MNLKNLGPSGLSISPKAVALAGVCVASVAIGAAISSSAPASPQPPRPQDMTTIVNDTMGLLQSDLVDLQLDTQPGRPALVQVPIDGQLLTLDLQPQATSRSDQYQVHIQIADGSLVEVEPSPVRTLRGRVVEHPGSRVAASMLDDGLHASILLPDGEHYWLEPVAPHVAGARAEQHVIYRAADAMCDGVCGVNAMQQHADQLRAAGGGPMPIGSVCKVALVGVDADYQYYQQFGSNVASVEDRVNTIINAVNSIYEEEVGIRHEISQIIVRTSSASNPYSTNNPENLLTQFRNHWNANHGSIPRNVAHLFTGRNLSGSTIGIAYLGVICNTSNAYGLSQHITPLSCMTDLTAHEMGHNWSAPHCSCPDHTMNASLTCANQFAASSISTIVNFRNSRWCLTDCPPDGPVNNTCAGTIVVGTGSTPFTNIGATTDGPDESADCMQFGDGQIQSDVYFGHVVQCTGELTISLCESSFNTKMAVYDFPCPTESGTVLACDVTSCPSNNRSLVTLPVTQGQAIRIRIGGHNGAQGNGVLTITCEPAAPVCPADLNGDSTVDVSDLLVLLGAWGPCGSCDEDLDASGEVDVADLLLLLSVWGDC